MTEQDWEAQRSSRDRLVVLVVGLGFAVVFLLVVVVVLVNLMAPEVFEDSSQSMQPTQLTAADLEPFTATFTDVASSSGVTAVQSTGAKGERLLPETMGSGIALGDFDGDRDDDLLLLSVGSTPTLYRNDSPLGGPIRFTDVTDGSGLGSILNSTTAALGDYDGDGRIDILVGTLDADHLLRNLGDLRFERVTRLGDGWTSAAGFADIDSDDDLDLVVLSYVEWSPEIDREVDYTLDGIGRAYGPPTGFAGTDLALHINQGDGTFTEESELRGLRIRRDDRDAPVMKGLGLLVQDIVPHQVDGFVDIFVANDTTANRLFRNNGSGYFEEVASVSGLAYDFDGKATGAMGVDRAFSANTGAENSLLAIGNFANEPSSFYRRLDYQWADFTEFEDVSLGSGVGAPTRLPLTFGTLLFDADLDGNNDLLQINGHIEPEIARIQSGQTYRQQAQLFRGTGKDPMFFEVPVEQIGALSKPIVGRSAVTSDLDRDGDPDLVVSHLDAVPLVLRNDLVTSKTGDSIIVHVDGPPGNLHAIGATVALSFPGVKYKQVITPTRSYMGQSSLSLVFSIPTGSTTINFITVTMPNQLEIRLSEVPVQDEITIRIPR